MSDTAQVFISYAHADLQRVRNLHERLRRAGLKPWIDEDDILGGKDWLEEIRSAIRQADFCLLCLSPNSINRRGVIQREIRIALDVQAEMLQRDIFLLPAWIQAGAPFPKEEMDDLPDALKRIQWINLGDPTGWDKLLRSINSQLARIGKRGPAAAAPPMDAGSITGVLEPTLTQLRTAIKARDRSSVGRLSTGFEGLFDSTEGVPSKVVRTLLTELSRQRWFDLVGRLADVAIRSGRMPPFVRRSYAEALLRHGFPSAGLEMLDAARSESLEDPTELRDANLHLGRAYAALYSSALGKQAEHVKMWIRKAIELCQETYRADPRRNLVHGSIAAALAARGAADGVLDNTEPEPLDVARRILEEVEQQEEIGRNISPEGAAAAVIAGIVTADQVSTDKWLDKFLQNAEIDLLDVDRLRTDLLAISRETTNELIAPLLLRIEERLGTKDAGELEVILPAYPYKTERWFRKGLSAASSVALIQDMSTGAGIASGFVLRGNDLRADWGDEFVLIANSYVVTEDASIRDTYGAPELSTLCARFPDSTHRIKKILFSSPPTDLDVSISRLDPPPVIDEPLKWVEHLPLLTKSRVYIIGHPAGSDDFKISDGELLDKDDVRLHYTTATEPGSSGSPVFNESWQVIGVHHAGSTDMHRLGGLPGTYAANEGISVLAVVNALNKTAQP